MKPVPTTLLALLLLCVLAQGSAWAEPAEVIRPGLAASLEPLKPLEEGWESPPTESRVQCWWWWVNGNVTKEAITRDLEAMRDKGIGGANIIDAAHASSGQNVKPPHGPDFGSPEWRELFVHALREADRLGLELGLNIQSGWNLGGPTVTPEQASKKLAYSTRVLQGGKKHRLYLAKPQTTGDYYREVKLLAIPLPEGEGESLARIENFEQKAYYDYPGGFTAVDASHLLETGVAEPGEVAVDPDRVLDLTHLLKKNRLVWDAPPGRWLVLRIGYTVSGARVSTSSDHWKGLAIDYLDPAAFDQYCEDVLDPILDQAGPLVGKSLRFLHTDSWELGPVNWTPAMPERFRELRGYDLAPYLPALAGYVVGDRGESTRFLNDFRRTIAELIADGKYRAFSDYAHRRGLGTHPESGGPHAAPVDALLCLGRNDIPMGEFWARSRTHRTADTSRLFVKQPSSAAHVYGRRYVMAEAFTTIGPHWERDPRELKPVFDRVACEGLNLVMWHTFDCSPASEGAPGQAYFAGTHLNPNVTWWDQADGFLGYLNRCQFLLQQGLPVSDVLYFYGENVPSFVRLKRDDPAGVQPDYDYDVVNAEALLARAAAHDGRVVLPDGVSYAALVLPPGGQYGLRALEHVERLAEAGVLVVGDKPASSYGLAASPKEEERYHEIANRLWDTGKVVDRPAKSLLKDRGVAPDFTTVDAANREKLDYIHRRTNDAEIYFVVNRLDEAVDARCSFRAVGRRPELWDPVDGTIRTASAFRQHEGRTIVPLRLPPNGSLFVVLRTPIDRREQGEGIANSPRLALAAGIDGEWSVEFDPRWRGPGKVVWEKLIDWTEAADPAIRHYSGTAAYETRFETPTGYVPGAPLWLDLGEVKNMARVYVNGEDLGVVWTAPFRVEASSAIQPGENALRVEVVNL